MVLSLRDNKGYKPISLAPTVIGAFPEILCLGIVFS